MDIDSTPPYTPSSSAPTYSIHPYPDEEVICFTPRSRARELPSGVFTKSSKYSTLVLKNQVDGISTPSFGDGAAVSGEVLLQSRESILDVEVKLKGSLTQMLQTGGKVSRILDDVHKLWTSSSSSSTCPSHIAFSFSFPSSFQDDNHRTFPLPPSFELPLMSMGSTVIFSKSEYFLTLTVTYRAFGFMTQTKDVRIPITYHPRTRPRRELIGSSLLSSIKTQPDEWLQVSSKITATEGSGLGPLAVDLFLPSLLVFAISDTIPFHLHISGPLKSLLELHDIVSASPVPTPENESKLFSTSPSPGPASSARNPLRVYIVRQTVVEFDSNKEFVNACIGEGVLRSVPPPAVSPESSERLPCLEWEGEIRCNEDVALGGFNAGSLVVKDFIMFEFKPSLGPASSTIRLSDRRIPQPIRLVTDPWIQEFSNYDTEENRHIP